MKYYLKFEGYIFSETPEYKIGAIIRNKIHQRIIKKPTIEARIILWNISQIKNNTRIPKVIIDQGWHQGGFKSQ